MTCSLPPRHHQLRHTSGRRLSLGANPALSAAKSHASRAGGRAKNNEGLRESDRGTVNAMINSNIFGGGSNGGGGPPARRMSLHSHGLGQTGYNNRFNGDHDDDTLERGGASISKEDDEAR